MGDHAIDSQFPMRSSRVVFLLAAAALSSTAPLEAQVINLRQSTSDVSTGARAAGALVAFGVEESGVDLDNDGDGSDRVMHVWNHDTGALRNLQLPVPTGNMSLYTAPFVVSDRLVAFLARELDLWADLNGDGDVSDDVVHTYDRVTDTVTNLGMAISPYALPANLVVSESCVAFAVPEGFQGQDLDGDGQQASSVLIFWTPSGGLVNTGRAVTTYSGTGASLAIAGRKLYFLGSEFAADLDFNGDGDKQDSVVHCVRLSDLTVTNLGLEGLDLRAKGSLVAFRVGESAQGNADLNGDGDAFDRVLHVHHASTNSTRNLEVAVRDDVQSRGYFEMSGSRIAIRASEVANSTDLNGDGDSFDNGLLVYDARSGVLHNSGKALLLDSDSGGNPFAFAGDAVLFGVGERDQAFTDLNGDGDVLDRVLHVLSLPSGTVVSIGVALPWVERPFRVSGRWASVVVGEIEQGGIDLDGDGVIGDQVLHVLDASTGSLRNLGLGIAEPNDVYFAGRQLLFTVRETAGSDLNGDGDSLDDVLTSYDDVTGATTNHQRAVYGVTTFVDVIGSGNTAVFVVSEAQQGHGSLNFDADTTDRVLHLLRL